MRETPASSGPSWYLDPLVAEQKRTVFRNWILDSVGSQRPAVVLKTDLFEEAYNRDHILYDLFPEACLTIGMDLDMATARRASRGGIACLACDVRALPLEAETVDVVVSTSTLDHFDRSADLDLAISELVRVLRPGGRMLLILDNPRNPLYSLLRWISCRGWTGFRLGHTVSRPVMVEKLARAGLRVTGSTELIHNPRLISTLLLLVLRRLLGRRADRPIGALLRLFHAFRGWPASEVTACFVAACAFKPSRARPETPLMPAAARPRVDPARPVR